MKCNAWTYQTANRLVAKKEEEARHKKHLQNITQVKKSVDNNCPQRFKHLENKTNTKELRRERASQIQHENRILLQKMLHIDGRPPDMSLHPKESTKAKSLHSGYNSREISRITKENLGLLHRLEAVSTLKKRDFDGEEKERKALVTRMCSNSNRYRKDMHLPKPPLNQLQKLALQDPSKRDRKTHEDEISERIEEFKASYSKQMVDHQFPMNYANSFASK